MPGETATPFFISILPFYESLSRLSFTGEGLVEMFLFHQLPQSLDGLVGIRSFSLNLQPGPTGGGEHAHLHYTLAIDRIFRIADGDIALKATGNIHKLHGGAHMKSIRVLNLDFRLTHNCLQRIFSYGQVQAHSVHPAGTYFKLQRRILIGLLQEVLYIFEGPRLSEEPAELILLQMPEDILHRL
jgi:hypothetical protein